MIDQLREIKRRLKSLSRRARAYRRLFNGDYDGPAEHVSQLVSSDARRVLSDLKRYAKIGKPAYFQDDDHGRKSAALAGRQEVVMLIMSYLGMSTEDMLRLEQEDSYDG